MQKEAIKMAKVGGLQKIYMFKEPNQKQCLYVNVMILHQQCIKQLLELT